MPAPTRTPRNAWIEEGLRALSTGGPDAVRVEALAQSLGVTKGGFYWHFPDRRALLAATLDHWEEAVVDQVIERVESAGGSRRMKLHRLFGLASERGELLDVELSIREWGRRDEGVAARLRRIDNRRMDYMRSLFGAFISDRDQVEMRCLVAFSLFIGNPFIVADHGDRSRGDVLRLALQWLAR